MYQQVKRVSLLDEFMKESMFDHISEEINNKILRVVCRSDLPRLNAHKRLQIYELQSRGDRYIFNSTIIQQSVLLTLPVDILVEAYGHLSDFQKMLFHSNGTFIILRRLNRDIKSQIPRFNMYDKLKKIPGGPKYLAMLADTSQIDSYIMNHSFADSVGTTLFGLERNGVKDNFGAIRDILHKMHEINKYIPNDRCVDIQSALDIFLFVAESISVGIDPHISSKKKDINPNHKLPTIVVSDDATYAIFEKHITLFMEACIAINTYEQNIDGLHFVATPIFPFLLGNVDKRLNHYNQIKKKLNNEHKKVFIKLIAYYIDKYFVYYGNGSSALYDQIEADRMSILFEDK